MKDNDIKAALTALEAAEKSVRRLASIAGDIDAASVAVEDVTKALDRLRKAVAYYVTVVDDDGVEFRPE